MTLAEIAGVVRGRVHGPADVVVSAPAYLDSRSPIAGGLFVAIVGEHADGHAYADGAHAVLGTRPTSAPTIVVADPVVSLGLLARHVLDQLAVTVFAVTGSQGKTGTKDYTAAVLRELAGTDAVVSAAGNHNNELGLPLTALRATAGTRFAVLEMGARHTGQIAYLCGIARPRLSAVLNVGSAHLGKFGGQEAIARAKGEIVEALPAGGVAVLNADDPLVAAMATRTKARVISFGQTGAVTWRDLTLDELGRPSFVLEYEGEAYPVTLLQSGAHQAANAAAAAALAIGAGLPPGAVAEALGHAQAASPWRMQVGQRADGLLVVNDAYNAHTESMRAGVEALAAIGERSGRRTVAVLGEMLELGDEHEAGHRAIGAVAADLGIDVLVVVGEAASGIAAGAGDRIGEVVIVPGREEATAWLLRNAAAKDVVLVKASRGVALEQIADDLLAGNRGNEEPGT
ncbi:UDP-N-acetylmuramoyl-tripeptide--D-alanyl-D-alanine ligase [Flindersiella endophytica]